MYRAQMPPKEEPPKYLPRMAQVLPWELKGCSLKSLVDSLGKVRTHESKLCFVMFCHVLNVKKLGITGSPIASPKAPQRGRNGAVPRAAARPSPGPDTRLRLEFRGALLKEATSTGMN